MVHRKVFLRNQKWFFYGLLRKPLFENLIFFILNPLSETSKHRKHPGIEFCTGKHPFHFPLDVFTPTLQSRSLLVCLAPRQIAVLGVNRKLSHLPHYLEKAVKWSIIKRDSCFPAGRERRGQTLLEICGLSFPEMRSQLILHMIYVKGIFYHLRSMIKFGIQKFGITKVFILQILLFSKDVLH